MPIRTLHHALAATALAGLATLAHAQSLPPGGIVETHGLTAAMAPRLAGTSERDESEPFAFFTGTGFVSGTVQHMVTRSVDGSLDFYWRIRVDAGSTGRVDKLTVHGFRTDPTSLLVADYRPDSVGSAPSDWAERSHFDGATIAFHLANGVGSGEASHSLLLDSKEAKFAKVGKLVVEGIGGGVSTSQLTFVPVR